jgi:hypothetical protein
MYLNGRVLIMEEHPFAQRFAEVLGKIGGDGEMTEQLGKTVNIYKRYGTSDFEPPVSQDDLFKFDIVLILIEGNTFGVYKSNKNPFRMGEVIYLLNSELKEFVNA